MRRIEIEGGWHGECLPGGEYAVSLKDQNKVRTHLGDVDTYELLFTRCSAVPSFRFAGQMHYGTSNIEYSPDPLDKGPSYGVNPVAYGPDGTLYQGNPTLGSQGIRYIDGTTVVTGDQTYNKENRLYEWTQRGDCVVGQGATHGAVLEAPEGAFLLEPGDCRFLCFNRSSEGSSLAVTIVKLAEKKTVLLWFDRSEITSFPRYSGFLDKQPGPINTNPEKDPPVPLAPNVLPILQKLASNRPDIDRITEVVRGKFTDEAVRVLGGRPWGRKDRDNNPETRNNSDDALCFLLNDGRFEIYDILAGDSGAVTFDYKGTFGNGENGFFRDVDLQNAPTKPQDAPGAPPVPPVDLTPFVQAINALGAGQDALVKFVEKLDERIKALENKPAPKYRVNGQTGSRGFHTHAVTLEVEEV